MASPSLRWPGARLGCAVVAQGAVNRMGERTSSDAQIAANRQESLRDKLIQAVNGHPISADDAWALIHAWDDLHQRLAVAQSAYSFAKTGPLD